MRNLSSLMLYLGIPGGICLVFAIVCFYHYKY